MEYTVRLNKLKYLLKKEKLDGVLISDASNVTYLTGFANFTNLEREVFLIITSNEQFILTDGRYSEAVSKNVPHFKLLEITSENNLLKLFGKLKKAKNLEKIGIEEENLTFAEYKKIKKIFKNLKDFKFPHRTIKTNLEVKFIEEACLLGDKTFKHLMNFIKLGVTENELALELEIFMRKNGGDISFEPIVAFGENSSVPHHETGKKALTKVSEEIVLLDFGAKMENYCSDMTRTIFFGKASTKQREIYSIVLDAQKKSAEFLQKALTKSGSVKASEVDKVAREYIISKNYPSIPHSLGHGIGLEVHEPPSLSLRSNNNLESGMVFSIEPGIYIPDFGGVRIEDLFVIERTNLRQLTNSQKDLTEL